MDIEPVKTHRPPSPNLSEVDHGQIIHIVGGTQLCLQKLRSSLNKDSEMLSSCPDPWVVCTILHETLGFLDLGALPLSKDRSF